MPTYEFICRECNQTVSVTASMEGIQTPKCLACLKDMARDYSFGAIKFVGNGFYSRDKNDQPK
jgi:putative FmdB family regulatory protein